MTQRPRFRSPAWLGGVVLIGWLVINGIWIVRDDRPPTWDEALHARLTLEVAQRLWQEPVQAVGVALELDVIRPWKYPPLVHLSCVPAAWIRPQVDTLIVWMNLLFGTLLVVSLQGMARTMGRPWIGVGATLLTLCQGLTVNLSRTFLLEFPLAAMVTWTAWRVLACDQRWTLGNGILLGIAIGMGLLTKWTFGVYVLPLVVWLLLQRPWGQPAVSQRGWTVAAGCLTAAIAIGLWWYVLCWPVVWRFIAHFPDAMGRSVPWALPHGATYAEVYYAQFGTLMPCIGLVLGVDRILVQGPRLLRAMLLWIAADYALLTLIPNHQERFLLPCVPLMAFVTWWGIQTVPSKLVQRGVGGFLVAWCLVQLAVLSSARLNPVGGSGEAVLRAVGVPLLRLATLHGFPARPMSDRTPEEVMAWIAAHTSTQPPRVSVLVDTHFVNHETLRYEALRQGIAVDIVSVLQGRPNVGEPSYDFIVYREPSYAMGPLIKTPIQQAAGAFQTVRDRYHLVASFALPDGDQLELYADRAIPQ